MAPSRSSPRQGRSRLAVKVRTRASSAPRTRPHRGVPAPDQTGTGPAAPVGEASAHPAGGVGAGRQAARPTSPPPQRGRAGHVTPSEHEYAIPTRYGDDRIVLMVKDPWWLFAYWEIQPSTERATRSQLLPEEVAGLQTILRVCDVTGHPESAKPPGATFDIALSGLARTWHIHANRPNRSFRVDIGILAKNGRFIILARSNTVTTPRAEPSEVIDPHWAITDEQFRALTGPLDLTDPSALGTGTSVLQEPLAVGGSSPAAVNPAKPPTVHAFWCRVEIDLIIYGATEPRSSVSVLGQPIQVRADGTFSVRLALPEGTRTITVEAVSPDGRQTRTVTPIIAHSTAPTPSSGLTPSSDPQTSDHEDTLAS